MARWFVFLSSFFPLSPRVGRHTVFGEVLEGMDIVEAIENVGSQSGKTDAKVTIANCGVLPNEASSTDEL